MNIKQLTEPLLNDYNSDIESQLSLIPVSKTSFDLTFDYEIDTYINNISEKISSLKFFPDNLVPIKYKCEPISCWYRKYIKSIVSKKKNSFTKKKL